MAHEKGCCCRQCHIEDDIRWAKNNPHLMSMHPTQIASSIKSLNRRVLSKDWEIEDNENALQQYFRAQRLRGIK
jgi:hypothetical protein